MQTDSLDAAMRVVRLGPTTFQWEVPTGWQQGRGVYGGLIFGAMAAAMNEVEAAAGWPLRAITAELPGPALAGPATIEVITLRRGAGLTMLEATVRQAAGVCARATGLFGRTRAETHPWASDRPSAPPWDVLPGVPIGPPAAPEFSQNFEYRLVSGPPFSGETTPATAAWLRSRQPVATLGPAELLAYVDAVWPSSFVVEPGPRPIATVSFQAQIFPAVLDPSTPLLYRARTPVSQEGFMLELRELWTGDGALLVMNQQTIVNIR